MTVSLDNDVETCPLCGSDPSHWRMLVHMPFEERLERLTRSGIEAVDYVYCECCGMEFLERFMSSDMLQYFYEEGDYRNSTRSIERGVSTEDLRHETDRVSKLIPFIKDLLPDFLETHLDVGCSTGVLLLSLHAHYQTQRSAGVEPSWRFRKYVQDCGFECVKDIKEMSGEFELVTLIHVLEHTPRPVEFLRSLLPHVGKYLFIQVPANLLTLAHCIQFSRSTLARVVEKAGYKILNWPAARDITLVARKA